MSTQAVGPPTIYEVAELAGVSTATVSRALNEPAKVASDARERVLAAVAALDYTPDKAAQSMARSLGKRRRLQVTSFPGSAATPSDSANGHRG